MQFFAQKMLKKVQNTLKITKITKICHEKRKKTQKNARFYIKKLKKVQNTLKITKICQKRKKTSGNILFKPNLYKVH